MNPNHLKAYELVYEIKIRGVEPTADVESKRKVLRGLLSQEKANRSFYIVTNPYTHDQDVTEMKETIKDLKDIISKFGGTKDDPIFHRVSSRLAHLSNRLAMLVAEEDAEILAKKEIQYEVLELEADLDLKISPARTSTPTEKNAPVNYASPSNSRFVPPYKWNIYFTGSVKDESVTSFLEKVELLRQARGVSEQELFQSACDLFRGSAWTWFVNNRCKFQNWGELVKELKKDFLPYFYEEDLEQEINSRTQGCNERVSLYISSMEGLFNRLTVKPDEEIRVRKIRRNLLPFYISGLALYSPKTVSELSELCKKLEESRIWADRYRAPSNHDAGLLEPDLSRPLPESNFSSPSHRPNFQKNNISTNISIVSNSRCWNCGLTGHNYPQCRKPRTVFCYGCGLKNTVKSRCNNCNSKNVNRGGEKLNVVTSRETKSSVNRPSASHTSTQSKGRKNTQNQ